ncbi:alpha/beta fold hydrolase [Tepidiforma thermophila]|uniref:Pimeloyl-ACP methyl ester carboxylesterase n=1 Tax=Tepidiforma thermophila (strain KCTC 52669 / CGMCC 1.13589 / G233) TaxID=2761530 RepID=A0A2A9HCZ2_TEPT2|nr:alpha/beta hydrolase [Tepidiforma thermophila]PFG73648.1 pimeloyl-ACP methyl ester carboxylesterase [Tepidiforma thermophila]
MTTQPALHGEDGYLTIHGLRHHYIRWGSVDNEPLVLLHGLMNNARYWEHIAERFVDRWCVYAPDLRGHGESEHAPGGYLVWAFAMDLRGFVEEMDLEAFDLVAHSIGSRIAMAYARDHSHRIKHLVLADMGPQMADQGARGIRRSTGEAQKAPGFATEAEAIEHFARLYPGRDRDFLLRQVYASLQLDEESGNLVFRFDPAIHQATGRGAIAEIPYLWESLEHITCPTLVIRAEKSKILSPEIAEEMVRRLPNGRLVEIPDAGHQVPLHQPEAFSRVVREFLES